MSSQFKEHRQRGRPRGFEEAEALEAAMRVFWRAGYEGASVEVLTQAMGVPRSSLYQLFGDKEALFLRAVEHYATTRLAPLLATLDDSAQLPDALGSFFEAVIRHATGDPERLGCLVACVLSDAAGADGRMREELARRFANVEGQLARRIRTAQDAGELPGHDPTLLAAVVGAVARGIMLSARAGVDAARLRQTAATAVAVITGS
jgi:AcrR family transcriptional regulator